MQYGAARYGREDPFMLPFSEWQVQVLINTLPVYGCTAFVLLCICGCSTVPPGMGVVTPPC